MLFSATSKCRAGINMIISLAFLAPYLVKAAIDGRLAHGMGVARLTDLPAEWSRQYQMLGLPANNRTHTQTGYLSLAASVEETEFLRQRLTR
jgi:hypothetical protein